MCEMTCEKDDFSQQCLDPVGHPRYFPSSSTSCLFCWSHLDYLRTGAFITASVPSFSNVFIHSLNVL